MSCVQVLQQTIIALRLRHPHIVTVMGTSVDPPTKDLLLITALLERGTLYDLLHNDTVSLPLTYRTQTDGWKSGEWESGKGGSMCIGQTAVLCILQ